MMTMKARLQALGRIGQKAIGGIGQAGLILGVTLATQAARAVNTLPGGPAVNGLDFPPAVTEIAAEQKWLHYFMLWICTLIFVGVFGVMFYSIFKHRKSKGAKAANFHESTTVEIIWTIVPFIIVICMALPATKTVVAMKDTSAADLTIKATGYQWKWGYDYLTGEGEGIGFISTLDTAQRDESDTGHPTPVDDYLLKVDNVMVVPVDKKVRIITTAVDVIHAWMVPAFGVKQDAIPGFVRDTWFRATKTGDYYGQCAELCGKEHAYMPIHVKVVSAEDYTAWVNGKKKEMAALADDPNKVWTLADLKARGEKIYMGNCAACHLPTGKGGGPVKPLDGSPVVLSADKGQQIHTVLEGRNNGAMPSWKQFSDTDLAAVITFTKNNWSNATGQIVQPSDVAAIRAGKELAPSTASAAPAAAPAAPAASTAAAAPGQTVSVLFASGKSALDADAMKAITSAAGFLKDNANVKVGLSGFVDASGDPAKNATLAKDRAMAVRAALEKAGVSADRVELRKPEQIEAGSASADRARRVDIVPLG
jgi:cytochrome c oxidase subunit 2